MALSSLPPEHKRSLFAAVALYAAAVGAVGAWLWLHEDETVSDWLARIPHAEAPIRVVAAQNVTTADPATDISLPPAVPGEGFVSIIMTDIGLSAAMTRRAIEELPPEVTLAFSPYGSETAQGMPKAIAAKHETLALLPMEPTLYPKEDPGPQALLTGQSDADNVKRIDWTLKQVNGATGVMNYMGSGLLADEKKLSPVLNNISHRMMFFVENPQTGADSVAEEVAEKNSARYMKADVIIDRDATELDIKQQLLKLENLAKSRGSAIGIAQPYPVTFDILKAWTDNLDSRGIQLVPLATLQKEKARHEQATQSPPQP